MSKVSQIIHSLSAISKKCPFVRLKQHRPHLASAASAIRQCARDGIERSTDFVRLQSIALAKYAMDDWRTVSDQYDSLTKNHNRAGDSINIAINACLAMSATACSIIDEKH